MKRTYAYCEKCDKVTELIKGHCADHIDVKNLKEEEEPLYSFSFKVKNWNRRVNQSQYNRDKMKDLISN